MMMNAQTKSERERAPAALIIEDDVTCLYLWRRYMEKSGFRAISTPEGKMALDMARQEKPDLVVLDILLPDADGWDVLRALKTDPSTRHIPVLVCSALYEESQSLSRGADGYLQKPVMYDDFLAALSSIGIKLESYD
jgi:CheY-like chemotaxis protein